jgi:recombination protein RecR
MPMHYPETIQKIISLLRGLPGVGFKSAERIAFELLDWSQESLSELGLAIQNVKREISFCKTCGAIETNHLCPFCTDKTRNKDLLCIVSSAKDLFSLEQTKQFHGYFHVLGSMLSPLEGKEIAKDELDKLKRRIEANQTQEVILAFDSTLEGDATSLFLKKALSSFSLHVYRLAFGLPVGSSLDAIDPHTLSRALRGKQTF